jgi:hypothetical protein
MWKLGLRPRNPQKGIHKWDFPVSVSSASQVLQVADQQLHRRSLFHIADTLINCVSFLIPYCIRSHQLCIISCSGLQTLSSIVSHCLFHILDALIICASFLVPYCRHSQQLCIMSCSGLQTLSTAVPHVLFRNADTLNSCVLHLAVLWQHHQLI